MKREGVETLMHEARESGGSVAHVDATYLYALCRRWLAVEDAHRTYVNSVYDTDAGEDRGEVLATLPESLVGFVRIVPEQEAE